VKPDRWLVCVSPAVLTPCPGMQCCTVRPAAPPAGYCPPGPPRRGRGRTRAQALAKYAFGLGFATMLVTGLVFMGMGLPPGHGLGTEILVRFFHAVRARPCPRRLIRAARTRACAGGHRLAPAPS